MYKEHLRLNQAAANALMARLEAQKAMCDSSEKELHRRFRERDEIEKHIRPEWEQARKRSRMDDTLVEERDGNTILCLPGNKPETCSKKIMGDNLLKERENKNVVFLPGIKKGVVPLHKELRVFLEEEQKASEDGLSPNEERKREEIEEGGGKGSEECNKAIVAVEDEEAVVEDKLQRLKIIEEGVKIYNLQFPGFREAEKEEDEESRKQRGKGNVEKWLQMLLGDTPEGPDMIPQNSDNNKISRTDEIIRNLDLKYPMKYTEPLESNKNREDIQNKDGGEEEEIVEKEKQDREGAKKVHKEINGQRIPNKDGGKGEEGIVEKEARARTPLKNPPYKIQKDTTCGNEVGGRKSYEGKEESREKNGKERGPVRSESARMFRRIPSSPMIIGMRKGVDCIGKKPVVIGDDDDGDEDRVGVNGFIKSSIKTIKKAVKM